MSSSAKGLLPPYARLTYSAHGEDAVLMALFEEHGGLPEAGFYVDVGAYHPAAFSNTALLHEAGWRGINIEPNPVMAEILATARPDDVTLRQAAGTPRRTAELMVFGDWASSNTLEPSFADAISADQGVAVEKTLPTEVVPLADVLGEHLPAGTPIDLLSVDVEGMDVEVLQSNDWGRYRPRVVAVEDLAIDLHNPSGSEVVGLLRSHGYRLASHAVKTSLYLREDATV